MSRRANPAAVGAFVLGGIAIITAGLIALGGGQLFAETNRSSVFFEGSVNGLVIGSPVKIQGVPVGQVVSIRAIVEKNPSGQYKTFTETVLEIDPRRFDQKSQFEGDPATEDRIDDGVRAQLNLQSLLTGQLYVALTIDPGSEGYLGPEELARYEQIASVPASIEEIEANVRHALDRLRDLPIEEFIANANQTIVAFGDLARDPSITSAATELQETLAVTRKLIRSADERVEPLSDAALASLAELESTLAAARNTLEPGSPLLFQIGGTLQDISQAAQAMRALANALERQPNSLVFGKSGDSE